MQSLTKMKHVGQGEYAVSDDPTLVLATLLGSCVSTCLFDPVSKVGGLNHMVLPNDSSTDPFDMMTQVNAMECLINGLLRMGAVRSRMIAKVFGGARMIGSSAGVGEKNARFVLSFLEDEGIPVEGKNLGGTQARRIRFDPTTGRAQLKFVNDRPIEHIVKPPEPKLSSGMELF